MYISPDICIDTDIFNRGRKERRVKKNYPKLHNMFHPLLNSLAYIS
jgi:hypothetical protein